MARRSPHRVAGCLLFAAVLLTACGGSSDGSSSSAQVTGQVLTGPTCPVETAASPCPPSPAVGAKVEVIQLDSVVASATTDADGNFTLTASAGPSLIRATATEGLPSADSLTVDLSAGKTTTVQLMLDTGIR